MRRSLYSLAAITAALSFATPAAAQDEVNESATDDGGWNGVSFGGRLG